MNKLRGNIHLCNIEHLFLQAIRFTVLILITTCITQCIHQDRNEKDFNNKQRKRKEDLKTPCLNIFPDDPYLFNIEFQRDSLYKFRLWFPELAIFNCDSSRAITEEIAPGEWAEKTENGYYVTGKIYENGRAIDFKYNISVFSNEAVKLELQVKNTGRFPWSEYAQLAVCLAPACKTFSDTIGNRTFIQTELNLLNSIKKAGKVDDFNHYPVKHRNDTNDPDQRFQVASGYVSRANADLNYSISFIWDESARVDVNPGGLDCIHSHPAIGPLKPGETITRTGFIVLTNTDAEQNFDFSRNLINQSLDLRKTH